MNFKRALFFPGAIALALMTVAPQMPLVAQTTPAPTNRTKPGNLLNLTPEQQQRLRDLKASTRSQREAALRSELNTDQQAQLTGQGQRINWRSLNLTPEQRQRIRAKMRTIRDAERAEMAKILTPEQLQQLEQRRQNRSSARPAQRSVTPR